MTTTLPDPTWTVADRLRWAAENWNEEEGKSLVAGALTHIEALRAEVVDLSARLSGTQTRAESAEAALTTARADHEAFKSRVRKAARTVQADHSHHISRDALNEWLDDLGIKKVVTRWLVTPTVNGEELSAAKVTADDAEAAEEKVHNLLRSAASAEATTTLRIEYPDRGDVYWTSENSTEVEYEGVDTPDWLEDIEYSVEADEEDD